MSGSRYSWAVLLMALSSPVTAVAGVAPEAAAAGVAVTALAAERVLQAMGQYNGE